MRAIPLDRSLDLFWDDLVYLEAALLVAGETEALAAAIAAHLALYEGLVAHERGARRTALQASARARIADAGIDDRLRALHSSLLYRSRQDHRAPAVTAVFPNGVAEAVRHALPRQVEVTEDIVRTLGLSHYDDALRAEHVPALTAAVQAGRAALEKRRGAELGRAEARLEVQGWKEEANALRLATYSQLLALAARTHRPRGWADAFFLAEAGRGRSDAGSASDAAEPAPEAHPDDN
jgi:hypothetical protein